MSPISLTTFLSILGTWFSVLVVAQTRHWNSKSRPGGVTPQGPGVDGEGHKWICSLQPALLESGEHFMATFSGLCGLGGDTVASEGPEGRLVPLGFVARVAA